jgi:hypothetical protein
MLCPAELWPAAEPPVPLPLPPAGPSVPPAEVPAVGEGPAPPPAVAAPLEPAVGGLGVESGPLSELHATSAKPARSAVPQAARARDGRRCCLLVTWVPIEKAQRARRRRSLEQVEPSGEGCELWGRPRGAQQSHGTRGPASKPARFCGILMPTAVTLFFQRRAKLIQKYQPSSSSRETRGAVEAVFDDSSALGPGAVLGKQRQHFGNHIVDIDVARVAVRRGRALPLLEPGARSQAR